MKNKISLLLISLIPLLGSCDTMNVKKNQNIYRDAFIDNISFSATSSKNDHLESYAFDGDYNSYWEADKNENQSITIDLKTIKKITSVVQIFNEEDIWYFDILASIDNKEFFEVVNASHGEFGSTFQESCDFYAQYIRLNIYRSEKGFAPTSKEFYCQCDDLELGQNLVLGKVGDASSYATNNRPFRAFDGDSATYYCASNGNYPQWLSVELDSLSLVKQIQLDMLDYGTYNFEVEGRDENGNWIKLVDRTSLNGSHFKFDIDKNIDALVYRTFSGPGWANLTEFKVLGFAELVTKKDGNVITLDSPSYISSIKTEASSVEYSIDGINYERLTDLSKANIIAKYIRCNDAVTVLGNNLYRDLLLNLDGTCTDYLDHAHRLNNITDKSSILPWEASTIGKEEMFEFDLGRKALIDHLQIEFLNDSKQQFIIETSVDKINYDIYFDGRNNNDSQKIYQIYNNSIIEGRYIRVRIIPGANERASVLKFSCIGLGNSKTENWWEDQSGVIRFYPKLQGVTLNEITSRLDEFRYSGYKIIELHQPYEGLADIWAGLGGTNNYKVDPLIGTLDDLERLINEAHKRGMYVFMFGNVGYGKATADYFKKACKDYALGINSKERNWFVFSDTCVDPTKWFYSDIANAYYYGYWGESGQIPTFNFENKEWQEETYNYIDFWSSFGIDGIALDAPDVYYFGKASASDVTYNSITKTLIKKNKFALPEGSGDNKFIASFYYNCIQNYAMSSWGGNAYSLGLENYLTSSVNDTDNIIKNNRDTTVSIGGVSLATMNFEDNYLHLSENERVLEAALVTSTGHLAFLHSGSSNRIGQDIMQTYSEDVQNQIHRLYAQQNSLAALNTTGHRYKLSNNSEKDTYSYIKMDRSGNSSVLPIFNYSSNDKDIQINLNNSNYVLADGDYTLYDSFNKESVKVTVTNGIIKLHMNKKSYRCLILR